jgi:regulator of cell morphogenesis and NO signaling
MTTIDPATTLGDLVTAHPHLAREFELLELDYCCGGQSTLADACVARGLDAEATASQLAHAVMDEPAPDWSVMGLTDLVDHLESTHHRYLWDELPRLSALVAKIVSVHGDRHPELAQVEACFEEIRHDLEPHLVKEERVLFPMIRELDSATESVSFHCGTLRNPISVMLSEHDTVGDLLARLRQLTNAYQPPADGCASYVACYSGLAELEVDTHLHIHKENNLLFPEVMRIESELAATSRTR